MEENAYRSWDHFMKSEYRRVATFQLSVEELAKDLYFDEKVPRADEEDEDIDLNI